MAPNPQIALRSQQHAEAGEARTQQTTANAFQVAGQAIGQGIEAVGSIAGNYYKEQRARQGHEEEILRSQMQRSLIEERTNEIQQKILFSNQLQQIQMGQVALQKEKLGLAVDQQRLQNEAQSNKNEESQMKMMEYKLELGEVHHGPDGKPFVSIGGKPTPVSPAVVRAYAKKRQLRDLQAMGNLQEQQSQIERNQAYSEYQGRRDQGGGGSMFDQGPPPASPGLPPEMADQPQHRQEMYGAIAEAFHGLEAKGTLAPALHLATEIYSHPGREISGEQVRGWLLDFAEWRAFLDVESYVQGRPDPFGYLMNFVLPSLEKEPASILRAAVGYGVSRQKRKKE